MQTEITLGLQGCLRLGRMKDEGPAALEIIRMSKRNPAAKRWTSRAWRETCSEATACRTNPRHPPRDEPGNGEHLRGHARRARADPGPRNNRHSGIQRGRLIAVDLPPTGDIALVVAGALAAGFVNGLSGTGYALVALGFWLHAMSPVTAAPLVAFCSVGGPSPVAAQDLARRDLVAALAVPARRPDRRADRHRAARLRAGAARSSSASACC